MFPSTSRGLQSNKAALVFCLLMTTIKGSEKRNYRFPKRFMFGASTSSYQIEGGWKNDGKGLDTWDLLTHDPRHFIIDNSTGDVACDSYHHYKEDVRMLKQMGVQFYRFSMEWARIIPTGHVDVINQAGIDYYNNLINELLANGIQPMVTLYHWSTPATIGLQHFGSFINPFMVGYYEDFCRLAFTLFGDRVKWWNTINEPYSIAVNYPKMVNDSGYLEYFIGHVFLLSHAAAYHLYDKEFRKKQGGKIGIVLNFLWFEPLTNSKADEEAAERARQFMVGWFAHPIFSEKGDYPPVMKEGIANISKNMGLYRSRLPKFTKEEINSIKGSADFLGLNHYSTFLATPGVKGAESPSYESDTNVTFSTDPKWPVTKEGTSIVEWGFRKVLNWIKDNYNNPTVIVTENGVNDKSHNDTSRIEYYCRYLEAMLQAIHLDGCNVTGYSVWSLMDNFEWQSGYTQKFGLYYVDFNDPNRTRTPKRSVELYTQIISQWQIPSQCYEYKHL